MDQLTLHIEYLLLRHDCVVIPEVGAFLKVRHPACYDYETGLFEPMTTEIRFNSLLSHDDGLLTASYARKYKVSFAEGRILLRKSVENLRATMHEDGEATLDRLGILSYNSERHIIFTPFQTGSSLATALGYDAIKISDNGSLKNTVNHSPAVKNSEEVSSHSEHKNNFSKFDTKKNYYIAINKRIVHYAASLIAIIAIGVSAYIPVNRYMQIDEASVIPFPKNHLDSKNESENLESRITIEEDKDKKEEVSAEASPEWHLIVATFHSEKEADNFIRQYKGSGYELQDISSATLHRVSARSGNDKEELMETYRDSNFKGTFREAWIYHAK